MEYYLALNCGEFNGDNIWKVRYSCTTKFRLTHKYSYCRYISVLMIYGEKLDSNNPTNVLNVF